MDQQQQNQQQPDQTQPDHQPQDRSQHQSQDQIEQRIRTRAYRIWLEEGQPTGRADAHWAQAKLIIAHEDGLATAMLDTAPNGADTEPTDAGTADIPGLRDQGAD